MSSKKKPNLPPVTGGKREPGAERRAAAAGLMREHERRTKRRRIAIQAGVGLVAVVAVLGTTIAVLSRDSGDTTPASSTPSGLTAGGTIRFGADDAPVTLTTVEDFQCPVCQQFEAAFGDQLAEYRAGDEVAVEYRPIAFLDRASSTEYSTRALNASMCVLDDAGADAWLDMHRALYEQQPAEGGAGLADDRLLEMAEDAGAGDVERCVEDRWYGDWAADQTAAVFDEGVTGTPTIFVNDEKLDTFDPAAIVQAVADAAAAAK